MSLNLYTPHSEAMLVLAKPVPFAACIEGKMRSMFIQALSVGDTGHAGIELLRKSWEAGLLGASTHLLVRPMTRNGKGPLEYVGTWYQLSANLLFEVEAIANQNIAQEERQLAQAFIA